MRSLPDAIFHSMAALLFGILAATVAWRLRLLTMDGTVAAAVVGAATIHAGAAWTALLLFFFASSNLLSHWRSADRERRTGAIVEKRSRRDARQVIANGGVLGLAALASTVGDPLVWAAVGAGAVAAATGDTWSTEVGTVLGGPPRAILTGRPVPPGTSGGVTVMGTTAALCGALLAALVARGMHLSVPVWAVAAGGLGGALLDSVLGATIQERRWCDGCSSATEQQAHRCGTSTRRQGGIPGMDNDMVNLASTVTGALITWWLR